MYSLKYRNLQVEIQPSGIYILADGRRIRLYSSSITPGPQEVPRPAGREAELEALAEYSASGLTIVVGPAGSGKTHLVSYFARNMAGRPVLWVPISETSTTEDVGRLIASLLNLVGFSIDPGSFDAWNMRYFIVEALAKANAILVIDDVHKVSDKSLSRFIRFLAHTSFNRPYSVILVGRSVDKNIMRWTSPEKKIIRLGSIPPQAFASLASRVSGEDFAVEEVVRISGRVPLLPILALALGRIARRIGKEAALERIVALYYDSIIRETLETDAAYNLVRALSLVPGYVPVEVVCKALLRGEDCPGLVRDLERDGVLEIYDDRVRVHDFYRILGSMVPPGEAARLRRRIGRELVRSRMEPDMVMGLYLLSEACDLEAVFDTVYTRLLQGTQWPYANLPLYVESLRRALSCHPPPRIRYVLEAEDAVMRVNLADKVVVAERLMEIAGFYEDHGGVDDVESLLVRLYSLASVYYSHAGMLEKARDAIFRANAIISNTASIMVEALTTFLLNMVPLLVAEGDYEAALSIAEELISLDIESYEEYFYAYSVHADLLRLLGRLEEAERELLELWRAISTVRNYESKPLFIVVGWSLVYLYLEKREYERALEYARLLHERASLLAQSIPSYREWADLFAADIAIIRAAMGDREAGARLFPREKCRDARGPLWSSTCYLYYRIVLGVEPPPGLEVTVDAVRIAEKIVGAAG